MRIAYWDDPTLTWDDPNFYWGDPSYVLEPGDPGYVPSPPNPAPPPPKRKTKKQNNTMHTDYIPQSYRNLLAWLNKQETELTPALAATIGMSVDERTAFLASIAAIKAKVEPIVAASDALEALTAGLPDVLDQHTPVIRAEIKRDKTRPACTLEIQTQLDWVGASQNADPETSRPTILIEAQRGRVKIEGRKPGFDSVNLYSRKKGDVQWKLIAIRKRKFPYYDESPLATPGAPEVREYMAIGVVDDEEVGQMSEIKEVVFAG